MVLNENNKIYIHDKFYDIINELYYEINSISSNGNILYIKIYLTANVYSDYVKLNNYIDTMSIDKDSFINKLNEQYNLIYRDEIFR